MRLASILIVGALSAGCVADTANNTTLVILKNQPPLDDCTVSGTDTATFISRGLIDAETGAPYVFNGLLQMRTEALNDEDPLQRLVTVRGAEIEVEGTAFTQRFTFVVQPGQTAGISMVAVPQDVIAEVAAGLGAGEFAQVIADIKVFGDFGQGEIESNSFPYPVDICSGCARQINTGSCADFSPEICLPGQDGNEIECCDDNGTLVCP